MTAQLERRKRQRRNSVPTTRQSINISLEDATGVRLDTFAKLVDVSDGGLGLELTRPVKLGSPIYVPADLADESNGTRVARVTWCTHARPGLFRVGVAFEVHQNGRPKAEEPQRPLDEGGADHYDTLQLSPSADSDMVHRVYRMLAQRYHPDNQDTGNEALFKQLLNAYKVLSDPELRAAYDVKREIQRKSRMRIFDGWQSSQGVEAERRKRNGVLSVLYAKRVSEPTQPSLSIRDLEELLGCPREHLEFGLWYLKENGCVTRTDNNRFTITVKGVDYAEAADLRDAPNGRPMLPAPQSA